MAKSSIALAELVEKGAKDDIVRELLTQIVARLMDFEIELRTGANYGERTADRTNSRNGYRDRLAYPEAATRHVLPGLLGAASDGGKGARRGQKVTQAQRAPGLVLVVNVPIAGKIQPPVSNKR